MMLAEQTQSGPKEISIIWTVLNFLLLGGGLTWLASKYGAPMLMARSKDITEGLAAGEKAKAEADKRAADVQAKLANLEKEIAGMREEAKTERDREVERIRRDGAAEVARMRAQAEFEIESAGKRARVEVQRAAVQLAIELAETKVRSRMSPEVQASLVQGFVTDLSRNGGIHLE
jgi:F-type H+-transporting ATPase subunit b